MHILTDLIYSNSQYKQAKQYRLNHKCNGMNPGKAVDQFKLSKQCKILITRAIHVVISYLINITESRGTKYHSTLTLAYVSTNDAPPVDQPPMCKSPPPKRIHSLHLKINVEAHDS